MFSFVCVQEETTYFGAIPPHRAKIQNIGTGVAPRTVHIDNQAVETVTRFTYLGSVSSDIDSDGYSYPEIHRRLAIAGSIMAQLDKVWRQQSK